MAVYIQLNDRTSCFVPPQTGDTVITAGYWQRAAESAENWRQEAHTAGKLDGKTALVAGAFGRQAGRRLQRQQVGVGAFSESLRQEVYKDKIRAVIIEPGAVATELTQPITNAEAKKRTEAFHQPTRVNVNEILIRPTDQER